MENTIGDEAVNVTEMNVLIAYKGFTCICGEHFRAKRSADDPIFSYPDRVHETSARAMRHIAGCTDYDNWLAKAYIENYKL